MEQRTEGRPTRRHTQGWRGLGRGGMRDEVVNAGGVVKGGGGCSTATTAAAWRWTPFPPLLPSPPPPQVQRLRDVALVPAASCDESGGRPAPVPGENKGAPAVRDNHLRPPPLLPTHNPNPQLQDFSIAPPKPGMPAVELKPGGASIALTGDNLEEYIELATKHKLLNSIAAQLGALLGGIYDVVPEHILAVFDFSELELFLGGCPVM